VKDCLESHREDPGFSAECKEEFEAMMEKRAADFRLDSTLREVCADDIEAVCGYERDSLDTVEGFDARVIQCLQVRAPAAVIPVAPLSPRAAPHLTSRAYATCRANARILDAVHGIWVVVLIVYTHESWVVQQGRMLTGGSVFFGDSGLS